MYSTRVHNGEARRPTRDDVARVANISGATVSRVLSGRNDVAVLPETRARVLEAARSLGYLPNTAARALTNGKTGIIGLWTSLAYSRYRAQVLDQMRSLLQGVEVTAAVTDIDEEFHFAHSFERALRVPVDGILAFDTSASVEAFARDVDVLAPNIPFVSMGAYWSEKKSYVGVDLRKGTELAMQHLLSLGRRSIAYLAPASSDLVDSGPRFTGYIEAMESAGLSPETIRAESFSYHAIQRELSARHAAKSLPDALLCLNDEAAIAASQILQTLGLVIGQDIAIVGFDGIEETEHASVPITTVRQPYEAMCALAWQFLQTQMSEPNAALSQHTLIPELVIRESTDPQAHSHTPSTERTHEESLYPH
ncbi:MAG: LacI family DNA-binding transcriptional regulator [Fimbriimonadaceae bacterium]|nr:LacI family DNA-binding transcriptional regulator [Fimbriimonadaceae bacterium]